MSKKSWSSVNFIVSIVVIIGAFWAFSASNESASKPPAAPISAGTPDGQTVDGKSSPGIAEIKNGDTLGSVPVQVINSAPPSANSAVPAAGAPIDLSAEMAAQLKGPPPELPEDLKRQLEAPPPELPDDLKAQLNAPPPPIPDDIKRALATPPRVVSIEEVNGPDGGTP